MRRIISLVLISVTGLSAAGCVSLEWLRGAGHYPGIAPSDFAFYDYCGTASQVFQFTIPQVQSAATEALLDLGFKDLGPAKLCPDEAIAISARTPDGRPATITFSPQNAMTNMRIQIGPVHLGDQMLTRDIFRRVGLNFGTLPRDYLPMEPTLARRINPVYTMPPPFGGEPPQVLEGEGLRPGADARSPSLSSPRRSPAPAPEPSHPRSTPTVPTFPRSSFRTLPICLTHHGLTPPSRPVQQRPTERKGGVRSRCIEDVRRPSHRSLLPPREGAPQRRWRGARARRPMAPPSSGLGPRSPLGEVPRSGR